MLVGMTTVLLFLTFIILLLQLVSKLTRDIALKEFESIELEKKKKLANEKRKKDQAQLTADLDNEEEIAVIAAAIAAFEAEKAASIR